jgi:hypothetical protein
MEHYIKSIARQQLPTSVVCGKIRLRFTADATFLGFVVFASLLGSKTAKIGRVN